MSHRLIAERMGNMMSIVFPEQVAKARERLEARSGGFAETVVRGKTLEQLRREQLRRKGY